MNSHLKSNYHFPHPAIADPEGQGIIAIGGDLEPATLIHAYTNGLFPWFNEGEPIAWWSPDPRCVVYPEDFQPKKSLKKTIKKNSYWVAINTAFEEVITQCAELRKEGTWISDDMIDAYCRLHQMGYAHSFEVWSENPLILESNQPVINPTAELIGGLYGLKIGNGFFGESMFHTKTDCSKIAFSFLAKLAMESKIELIDCQVENPHLMSLGAICINRQTFLNHLQRLVGSDNIIDWQITSLTSFSHPAHSILDSDYHYLCSF